MPDKPCLYVICAPPEAKYARHATPRYQDPRDACPEVQMRLDAARGQTVAFQAIVFASPDAPVRNLRAVCESPIEALRAEYIDCPNSGRAWPDPLPPLGSCDVPAGCVQPLWFDLPVPADAPPGQREILIRLLADTHQQVLLRIRLRVSAFVMPVRPAIDTAIGVQTDNIAAHCPAMQDPDRRLDIVRMHFEAVLCHGLSPYPWSYDRSDTLPLPFIEQLLRDPRASAVRLPFYPDSDELLRQAADRARQLDAYHKCYWYEVDEPVSEADYQRVHAVAERLRRVVGDHRMVVPFYRRPEMPAPRDTPVAAMAGDCGIWCALSDFFASKDEPALAELRKRQQMGEELWTYVCMGPEPPAANLLIDQEGLTHRILFWQVYGWECTGFLYWSATKWYPAFANHRDDLWQAVAAQTPPSPLGVYGDGTLLYPGRRIGQDQPIASQRLKLARRGMDDLKVLKAYEQTAGREKALALARRMAPGFSCYERLDWRLNGAVWDMMQAIAGAQGA